MRRFLGIGAATSAVWLVVALCAPSLAFGWYVQHTAGDRVTVVKTSTDATGQNWQYRVHKDYKGGETISATHGITMITGYNTVSAWTPLLGACPSFDVELDPNYKFHLIEVQAAVAGSQYIFVINETPEVRVIGTPTVNVNSMPDVTVSMPETISVTGSTVKVSEMPSLTVNVESTGGGSSGGTSTASIEGTLPVTIAGLTGVSDLEWQAVLIVGGGVLGFAAYRGLSRVWMGARA